MPKRKRYRVRYKLDEDERIHYRYYCALNKSTAEAMFNETCTEGSLTGSRANVLDFCKQNKSGKWQKTKK